MGHSLLIWSLKGGQGKTSISIQISLLEDYYIVTNDIISPIEKIIDHKKVLKLTPTQEIPNLPNKINVIYDFGGYPDQRLIKLFKKIDYCIIPIAIESNDDIFEKQGLITSINEVSQYTKKIIIVINKVDNKFKKTIESIKKLLIKSFPSKDKKASLFPIFEIKKTSAFSKSIKKKKSIKVLCENNPLLSYHYKEPLKQINELIIFTKK